MINRKELIEKVQGKMEGEVTKKLVDEFITAFTDSVKESLAEGEKVQLVGFGSFEARDRKAREGRNPRNPEEVIQIPASKAPVFKAGKALKEAVNG